eukprot:scaffold59379_cov63-Phaeocystis_antarctica.AAC.2
MVRRTGCHSPSGPTTAALALVTSNGGVRSTTSRTDRYDRKRPRRCHMLESSVPGGKVSSTRHSCSDAWSKRPSARPSAPMITSPGSRESSTSAGMPGESSAMS